jgi:hypothetical protein
VTGFADQGQGQGDNIQQSAPTTGPQGTIEQGIVEVDKFVRCPQGVVCPKVFRIHAIGNNPSPENFTLKPPNDFKIFLIGLGNYRITEDVPPAPPNLVLNQIFDAGCTGVIESDHTHKFCLIINEYTVKPATQ